MISRLARFPAWLDAFDVLVLGRPKSAVLFLALLSLGGAFLSSRRTFDHTLEALVERAGRTDAEENPLPSDNAVLVSFAPAANTPPFAGLAALRDDLKAVPGVVSAVSLLDAPIFPDGAGTAVGIKSLEEYGPLDEALLARARKGPFASSLFISEDGAAAAVRVELRADRDFESLKRRRSELRARARTGMRPPAEMAALASLEKSAASAAKLARLSRAADIAEVQAAASRHSANAEVRLGGSPVFAAQAETALSAALSSGAAACALALIAAAVLAFRNARWAAWTAAACLISAALVWGGVSWAAREATILAAGFLPFQIAVVLSLMLHGAAHLGEAVRSAPGASHRESALSMAAHSLFPGAWAALAAASGFAVLAYCGHLPTAALGRTAAWSCSAAWLVGSILTAAAFMLGAPSEPRASKFAGLICGLPAKRAAAVAVAALLLAAAGTAGWPRLKSEPGLLGLFRSSTPAHATLAYFDERFGGASDVDVLLSFPDAEAEPPTAPDSPLSSAIDDDAGDDARDWFAPERLSAIEKTHDALSFRRGVGSVVSLATLVKAARDRGGRSPGAELMAGLPDAFRAVWIDPFVSAGDDRARLSARLEDSAPGLPSAFRADLARSAETTVDRLKLAGARISYGMALERLSGIVVKTLAWSWAAQGLLFLVLFRSLKAAAAALAANFLCVSIVLGGMGWFGIPFDLMTAATAAVALGLAAEPAVRWFSRLKEECSRGDGVASASSRVQAALGAPMLSAGLAGAVVFASLSFSPFMPAARFGAWSALAALLGPLAALTVLPALAVRLNPFRGEK